MKVEISIGELVDKATILSIKLEKITDPAKLCNVHIEYEILHQDLLTIGINPSSDEYNTLKQVNQELWDIEDLLRIKELKQEFDEQFIALARSVYYTNDRRSIIKREINLKFNSLLIEEKEYVDYNQSKA